MTYPFERTQLNNAGLKEQDPKNIGQKKAPLNTGGAFG